MDVKVCDWKGGLDWIKEKLVNMREVIFDDGGWLVIFGFVGGCEIYCLRNL